MTLPLTWPRLIAGGVLVFVKIWNEFLISDSLTLSDDHRLIEVGIFNFITQIEVQYWPLKQLRQINLNKGVLLQTEGLHVSQPTRACRTQLGS